MNAIPRLLSLATAVPPHTVPQDLVVEHAMRLFDRDRSEIRRMLPVFGNSGIENRHCCVPGEWFLEPHGWVERSRLFVDNAVDLLADAARRCVDAAGLRLSDVDGVVAVSTTGITTPSLDALLIERLGLRPDVRRLPVFGLGCAGGVIGLSHAATMAQAIPGRVLFLVVELCALTFRFGDNSQSNIVAAALFGDGAAAALVGVEGDGPRLGAAGLHTWPRSLDVMGWRVEEDGLGVLFSRDIPTLVRTAYRGALDGFLHRLGLGLADFAGMICHPGGTKVIEALEEAFELPAGRLVDAREVLRHYGNMSAVTVLFVLERMVRRGLAGRYLMSALGPGFTAAFQVIESA
ncbi:MAG: 3-oxoacyl-[acyl-carrier-protein] synthase III C-terminal domain-containing protein [Dongiaceae bacterium]